MAEDNKLGVRFDANIEGLLKKIEELGKALEGTRQDFEKTGRELSGAFDTVPQSLETIANLIKEQTALMDKNQQAIKNSMRASAEEAGTLQTALEGSRDAAMQQSVALQQSSDGIESSRSRLKVMREELVRLREQGLGPTDEAFAQLEKQAAELQDAIDDVTKGIKKQSSDTRSLDNVINVAQSAASAIGLYQSALVAMGVEEEKAAVITAKLQSIMVTIQGLQQLQNTLLDNSTATYKIYHRFLQLIGVEKKVQTAATVAQTAAVTAETVATEAATTATKGLWATLMANPLFAILAGILALATAIWGATKAIAAFVTKSEDAKKSIENLNRESANLNRTLEERKRRLNELKNFYKSVGDTEEDYAKREVREAEYQVSKINELLQERKRQRDEWWKSAWWHSDDIADEFNKSIKEEENRLNAAKIALETTQQRATDESLKSEEESNVRTETARKNARQARIEAMKDGQEKELKQLQEGWENEKKELRKQEEEAEKHNKRFEAIEVRDEIRAKETLYQKKRLDIIEKYNKELSEKRKKEIENEKQYAETIKKIREAIDEYNNQPGERETEYSRRLIEEDNRYKAEKSKLESDQQEALRIARTATEKRQIKDLYKVRAEQLKDQHEKLVAKIHEWAKDEREAVLLSTTSVLQTTLQNTIEEINKEAEKEIERILNAGGDPIEISAVLVKQKLRTENALYDDNIAKIEQRTKAKKEQLEIDKEAKAISESEYQRALSKIESDNLEEQIAEVKRLQVVYEEFGASADKVNELKDRIAELERALQKLNATTATTNSINKKETWDAVGNGVKKVTNEFNALGNSVGSVVAGVGGMFDAIQKGFNQTAIAADDTQGKINAYADAATTIASTAISLYNANKAQRQANQELKDAYRDAQIAALHQAALTRIEANQYEESLFGVNNPYEKAIVSIKKYEAAQKELATYAKALGYGQVQTGTKKETDWGNVASTAVVTGLSGAGAGATIGAAIGTAAGPVGTAIGAAVGVIAGALVSYFGSSQKEYAVYASLKQRFGHIYDPETFELNKGILASYALLDESTKNMVDNWEEIKDKMQEAKETLESTISELMSDVGDSLTDSLVNAFRSGELTNAIDDFKDYITDKLRQLYMGTILNNVFGTALDNLETSMKNSMGLNGATADGEWVTDLQEFFGNVPYLIEQAGSAMEAVQQLGEQSGYDIFGKNKAQSQSALSGTVSSMTEQTAEAINGNFLGLKLTAMEINAQFLESNNILTDSLSVQRQIADNTRFCERLVAIENTLKHIDSIGVKAL